MISSSINQQQKIFLLKMTLIILSMSACGGEAAQPNNIKPLTQVSPIPTVSNQIQDEIRPNMNTSPMSEKTPLPQTEEEKWEKRVNEFMEKYWKERIVNCGDSYFLIYGGPRSIYATKAEPIPEVIKSRYLPASELTEADKLNNMQKGEDQYELAVKVSIEGPWTFYDWNGWRQWSNHGVEKSTIIRFSGDIEGKLNWTYNISSRDIKFYPIGKYKCVGNNIDVESIPD